MISYRTTRCRRSISNLFTIYKQRRPLLTLAIETSCDDTSVAILEHTSSTTQLHFHEKITSDNRSHGGIHPIVALQSHQTNLATLVQKSLRALPIHTSKAILSQNAILVQGSHDLRKIPDFVTVTRGPGMTSSLNVGIDTAKGLATAWQVPLLGVNHMQAHALTPRLQSVLGGKGSDNPRFPFLTLLLSGGHTMLVHSHGLCDHRILAETSDAAIGDILDKCARDIIPADELASSANVMYGQLLEDFAFPKGDSVDYAYKAPPREKDLFLVAKTPYEWFINPPFASDKNRREKRKLMEYSFSGIGSQVQKIMAHNPAMPREERQQLARETMRIAFEHLITRLLMTLDDTNINTIDIRTVVVAGGVAANRFFRHILRTLLDARDRRDLLVVSPPPALCTDNAAMIAWTGMEMWKAGWRSSLGITALRKWTIDPAGSDGGILGVGGWEKDVSAFGVEAEDK